MVPDPPDMSHPVTRAELREELASYPTREELRETLRTELASYPTRAELRETLRTELAAYATKADLEVWAGAIIARTDEHLERRLDERLSVFERRVGAEIAHQIRAAYELFRTDIRALDDKYNGLPPRVDRLEA